MTESGGPFDVKDIHTARIRLRTYEILLTKYENALHGIASCCTECMCCRMMSRIARRVLGEDIPYGDELDTRDGTTGRQVPQVP